MEERKKPLGYWYGRSGWALPADREAHGLPRTELFPPPKVACLVARSAQMRLEWEEGEVIGCGEGIRVTRCGLAPRDVTWRLI